jgi:uncharacterized membrane protein YfcA
LSADALTLLFAVIAIVVALQFILGRPDFIIRQTVPGGIAPPLVGGTVGGLSALMGIGGGSLSVPLLSLCNVPIHRAIGTASGFGLAIAVPATLGLGFAVIAVIAAFTVPFGVKAAHAMDAKRLKQVFGILLLAVALNMMRESIF